MAHLTGIIWVNRGRDNKSQTQVGGLDYGQACDLIVGIVHTALITPPPHPTHTVVYVGSR